MFKDPLPYLVLLGITAVIAAATVVRLRREDESDGTKYRVLQVLFGAVMVWNLAALLNGIGFSPSASYQFVKLTYLSIPVTGTAWFAFALAYSDRGEFLSRRVAALLAVEPVLVTVAVATNDVHRLFWTLDWSQAQIPISGWGPLFWVHAVYLYCLTLAGVVVMADVIRRRQRVFQIQSLALAVGALFPLVGNVLFLSGVASVDPTPVTFAFSGLLYYWAIERADLVTLTPVARKTVIDTMGAGMFVVDCDDRLVDVNRQGKRLLAVDRDTEVVGRAIGTLLSDGSELLGRFDGVVQATETVTVDTERGRRHYEVEVSPVTVDGDRVARLFLVHDVTDRRERQRTLERKNEQLDEFASVVSHDLRNPLSVAEGYVDMIADRADDPEVETLAAEAAQSHDRMERLIDDVLSMARGGDTVADPSNVSVADVARDAWSNVDGPSMQLSLAPDTEDCRVLADRDKLQRAFENLFRNAREHAGDDVTVIVDCDLGSESVFDPTGDTLYVDDDGPGIPPEDREDVLEKGYTTSADGTGFGLPIVREIAEAHGWDLRIEESDAGGTRIVFADVASPRQAPTSVDD